MLPFPITYAPRVCSVNIPVSIIFLSIALILISYFNMANNSHSVPVPAEPPSDFHFKYTVLKGYFMQSEDSTDDTTFDFKKSNFGLINRTYPTDTPSSSSHQWKRFETHIRSLAKDDNIKVLWLGRHGQGWHNVAESKYGTKAWDCYYSALNGADNITWSDAHLTPTGSSQALAVHDLWAQQLPNGIPMPDKFIVSPLTRTIETADLTFQGLSLPYQPYIKELVREVLGIHTCDRRSTLTHLTSTYPHLTFEPNFSDPDLLWETNYREPLDARKYRLATFLDDVFAHESGVFVSMTSHSGAIASMLDVVGHREFQLETGGVICVVVRAERVEGKREVPERGPSDGPEMCDGPPGV
ncbi:histidine phosphatase superfamily [Ampelomyces quisqualis]|uniref:Histidine phosphatase superfamily n=1 Tax=Ampelomyces quisqualis TaxID=50730 RepID=A0A6A5QS59_AMPQU|nr:histidine phosphatase superfamily [Ampelomyces quisqualis]